VHSHFIPGIDDGAKTIEDSLQLISELKNLGYENIITTPHVMADFYRNTPEIILSGLEKVREAIKQSNLKHYHFCCC
jgi:protein-tyrosine phosphatase